MQTNLRNFINDYCIFRCPPGYYLKGIPEGKMYSWQFYLRNAIYYAPALNEICNQFIPHISDQFQYAAMESAGPPILTALQMKLLSEGRDLCTFGIRKSRKEYGLLNWFEGMPDESKNVVLIDDISNSKTTLARAKMLVESTKVLKVDHALSIVDKKGTGYLDDMKVISLFGIDDFDLTWDSYKNNPPVDEFVQRYSKVLYRQVSDSVVEPVSFTQPAGFDEISSE